MGEEVLSSVDLETTPLLALHVMVMRWEDDEEVPEAIGQNPVA